MNNILYIMIITNDIDINISININENNIDGNYFTSSSSSSSSSTSSSQSTSVINTAITTVTIQVNNDFFCNTCNEISDTNNISYHNFIKGYDNKLDSSIGNNKSEPYMTINDTTETSYLNIIFVELFVPISATDNTDYLSIINVEPFDTISETTKASYRNVIREEKLNSNGEATEENIVYIDDIGNSRPFGVTVERTITPRGGVKYNAVYLGSSIQKRMHQRQQHNNDNYGGNH